MQWQDRAHFFAVSAQLMRRILVDRARRRNLKRGGGIQHIDLNEAALLKTIPDITALDDALNELSRVDQRKVQIVEMTTTDLIDKTDMIAVMPRSIADSYAQHGLLKVLPCDIRHKMESFGSITRKDRPLSEAAQFFLSVLHRQEPAVPL